MRSLGKEAILGRLEWRGIALTSRDFTSRYQMTYVLRTTTVRLLAFSLQAHSVFVSDTTYNPFQQESTCTPLRYHIVRSTTRLQPSTCVPSEHGHSICPFSEMAGYHAHNQVLHTRTCCPHLVVRELHCSAAPTLADDRRCVHSTEVRYKRT